MTVVARLLRIASRWPRFVWVVLILCAAPRARVSAQFPNSLWIGNDLSTTLPVLNTDLNGNVLRQINPTAQTSGIAVDVVNNILYTAGNFFSAPIIPRDLTTLAPGTPFTPATQSQEDMTFDGAFIWRITSDRDLERINPNTQQLEATFNLPGLITTLGIAWDGSGLWVSEYTNGGSIKKYTTTGTLAGPQFNVSGSFAPAGLAYDPNDNTLYIGTDDAVYHYTVTGTQLGSFAVPGRFVDGLEFEGSVPVECTACSGECCGGRPRFTDPAYAGFGNLVSVGTASPDAAGPAVIAVFDLVNPSGGHPNDGPFNTDFGASIYSTSDWIPPILGSVFGVTLDRRGNIYVASTTCYNTDTIGSLASGSAGAVYKIDTLTSVPSLFVAIPNSGPALGNICYDCEHNKFFVSNMDDGKIYRISNNGEILSDFDFGVPDNGSIGFAPPLGDRIWAVQEHNGRLYFSVWWEDGGHQSATRANEIWSIALTGGSGNFDLVGGTRLEVSVPPRFGGIYSNPVSDMRFTPTGTMLVSERGMDDETTPHPHEARLLEFECVHGVWILPDANKFRIGAGASFPQNSAGGVDMDYDIRGGRVYNSGDDLYVQSGPQWIFGIQGLPSIGGTVLNSILVDYNGMLTDQNKSSIGDVAIPCTWCGPHTLVYHEFDDPLNIEYDSSGNGYDGLPGGAATVVTAPCGHALNFLPNNGVHEYTISRGSGGLDLIGASPMTGMALIRPLGPQSNGNPSCLEGTIFSKGGNYWFSVDEFNGGLVFQNEGSGSEAARVDVQLCIGAWTHVAFIRAADGRTIRFFVNGLPIGSPTILNNLATANNSDVMVGNYGFNDDPSGCQFNGDIDEIRIYDRALSDAEIRDAYECGCRLGRCNPMVQYCRPGIDSGLVPCPCGNPPADGGLGCNNFGDGPTRSATLDAAGVASLTSDTVQLIATGENNTSLTVFWTGTGTNSPPGVQHGAGVRCVTGLKRLYMGEASGGAISRPGGSDLSVSVRTAAAGAPISAGQTRHYFTVYRDPAAAGPCGNTSITINLTNAGSITWGP